MPCTYAEAYMLAETTTSSEWSVLEDPLSYLPCSTIGEYRKGQLIYESDRPNTNLYLVLEGCVKVTRMTNNVEVVMNLCQVDDLFGEPAFVQASGERAVALEPTKVMSWPIETVHEIVQRHPKLGIALMQTLAARCFDLEERIATLSADSTARRLAKALLGLSERLGQPETNSPDSRRLAPFSHKLLAQYIGTTREAVTHTMNQFRRQGLVSYSRRDVVVYTAAMRQWLGTHPKRAAAAAAGANTGTGMPMDSPANGGAMEYDSMQS